MAPFITQTLLSASCPRACDDLSVPPRLQVLQPTSAALCARNRHHTSVWDVASTRYGTLPRKAPIKPTLSKTLIRQRRPVRFAHSGCSGSVTWSCGQEHQSFSADKVLEQRTCDEMPIGVLGMIDD